MLKRRLRRARAGSEEGSPPGGSDNSDSEPEPFEEMNSIFRIVTLYEMVMQAQWSYLMRYMKERKTELIIGMYIGSAFELIRFVCMLVVAVLLILMRISVISPFNTYRIVGNMSWISTMNTLAFWTSAILCILIFVQFAVYQGKNRAAVVISTSFNFMFSIIMIGTIIHLVIWKSHNEAFMKEGLHKKVMIPPETMSTLSNYQARMKCCGVDGPSDYEKSDIIRYLNPLTNHSEGVPLTREFSLDEGRFYSLPVSCCKQSRGSTSFNKNVCSQRNLTQEEVAELKSYETEGHWDLMLKFFALPEPGTYYTKGCLTEYKEAFETYVYILLIVLVIFAIFTALTIAFVIVLLLYHDGIGHMVSERKMFEVERNTGVHFLMSLDMIDTDFQDDFSLIEFLRRTDIDRFMAGDRLGDTVNGRKEAEKM